MPFNITYMTGPPGCGKSFSIARELAEHVLRMQDVSVLTNFPWKEQALAEYVAGKTGETPSDVLKRMIPISPETLKRWSGGLGGPWELRDSYAANTVLILDEIHNFIPKMAKREQRLAWEKWLGECRHEGWARIVFVTQAVEKVSDVIEIHAENRSEITSTETMSDPWFKIPSWKWRELWAGFVSGKYHVRVFRRELKKRFGKWERDRVETYLMKQPYFSFYNSHSAPGGGSGEGGAALPKREFERRTRAQLLWWFYRSHPFALMRVALIVGVVVWFSMFGGVGTILGFVNSRAQGLLGSSFDGGLPGGSQSGAAQSAPQVAAAVPTVAQVERLNADVVALRKDNCALKEELELARARETEWVPVMVSEESVTFSNGDTINVAERIENGPYEGHSVDSIDLARGRVHLSGGVVLRLGGGLPRRAAGSRLVRRVPTGVPGSAGGEQQSGVGAAGGKEADAFRAGDHGGGVPAPGEQGERSVSRGER